MDTIIRSSSDYIRFPNRTQHQRQHQHQRAEVALQLEGMFKEQARVRQATSTGGANPQLMENLPEAAKEIPPIGYCAPIPADHHRFPESQRTTRDAIASIAGISGRTIDKVKTIQRDAVPQVWGIPAQIG